MEKRAMEQKKNSEQDQRLLVIEDQIDRWFVDTMHNSPVSRATDILNHVRASVDALKQRLAALFQEF
jgi:hypothetical protein